MSQLSFMQLVLLWCVVEVVFILILLRSGWLVWVIAIAGAFTCFIGLRTAVDILGVSSSVAAMLLALLGRVSGIGVSR